MELTPEPPEKDDKNGANNDNGKGGLVLDPAGAEVNASLGPYTPAIVNYLLHPPPGNPVPGMTHPTGLANNRDEAMEKLIQAAFQP